MRPEKAESANAFDQDSLTSETQRNNSPFLACSYIPTLCFLRNAIVERMSKALENFDLVHARLAVILGDFCADVIHKIDTRTPCDIARST